MNLGRKSVYGKCWVDGKRCIYRRDRYTKCADMNCMIYEVNHRLEASNEE